MPDRRSGGQRRRRDQEGLAGQPRRSGHHELDVTADTVSVASSSDWASVVGHADATATNPNTHGIDHFTQNYVVYFAEEGRRDVERSRRWPIAVPPPAAAPAPAAPAKS